MAKEKPLERKIKILVERKGGQCIKLVSMFFTGLPDRMVLMPGGRVYFAEMKTTGEDLSPRQKLVRALLQKLGFSVYKIDSEETLKNFIDEI